MLVRNILKLLLIIFINNYIFLEKAIVDVESKFISYNETISTAIVDKNFQDEINLIFDYEIVNRITKDSFLGNETEIIKINESAFILLVRMKKGMLIKEIKEKYYIKKGEKHD